MRKRTILSRLMDGMSMDDIARSLRISRMTVHRIRREFVNQLVDLG
ncbi:helix-turn-helix domain-containing protein [Marininema mesophilum]